MFLPGQSRVALIFEIGYEPISSEDRPEMKAD
jgi:hypothetical protein